MPVLGSHAVGCFESRVSAGRTAVKDFMEPSLVVVGGEDPEAVRSAAAIYAPLAFPPSLVSLRTAEMIKYACNAFHAVKIAFANEIGALSAALGVDATGSDGNGLPGVKLNVSAAYLRPGFAFGGSCLPKDLRALVYRAGRLDLHVPMLETVLPSNEKHLERAIGNVLELAREAARRRRSRIQGKYRRSSREPGCHAARATHRQGPRRQGIRSAHSARCIYGSNRNFILQTIPHIGRLLCPSIEDLLASSDQLVVVQKQSRDDFAARSPSRDCQCLTWSWGCLD